MHKEKLKEDGAMGYADPDDIVQMIEGKMEKGVSRLSLQFTDELEYGQTKEKYHHGRCDVGSPWAKGTVGNCD